MSDISLKSDEYEVIDVELEAVSGGARNSCYRTRLRQLLRLGHDYDLAQEEALLICG